MVGVTLSECSRCGSEGKLLYTGRPGAFSNFDESFFPSEAFEACPDCSGEGELEVCEACLQPFAISQGREVCGCAELAWLDAA